jgi:hypothetical protein
MSDTAPGSWQPDPFGRFSQRYWDGANWTENVIDASGTQTTDPPVPSAEPSPAAPTATPSGSALPVPSLVVVGVGALLLLLSLFVLNWFEFNSDTKESLRDSSAEVQRELGVSADSLVDGMKLSEVRDLADKVGTEDLNTIADQYITWGYLVSLFAIAIALFALFQPKLRWPALAIVVLFVVWHAFTVYELGGSTIDTQLGAWLGAVGLAIAAIGLLLPRQVSVAHAT